MIRIFKLAPQRAELVEQPGPPTLEQLYAWIGTDIVQCVPVLCGDDEPCQLIVDENGKLRRSQEVNKFATILFHGSLAKQRAPVWAFDDYIVGIAVLLTGDHKLS